MNHQDFLPEDMWDDPAVQRMVWPEAPPEEPVVMDITNADPNTLLGYFDKLSEMVDWQDLRTAAAGATRSNSEDDYDRAVDRGFEKQPKTDGSVEVRQTRARIQAEQEYQAFRKARTRHEIYRALLRRLERRLRVVEETLWTRKAALKARGGY